jgi:hypothetical protein
MGQPAPVERRKQPRVARRLPVRFGTESQMRGGTVIDISDGGLRIETQEPFPVNSLVLVFVQFPRNAIRLRARVAWAGGSSPRMGLSFTQPEPNLTRMYSNWLAEVKQASKEAAEQEPGSHPAEASPAAQPAAVAAPSDLSPSADPPSPPPPSPKTQQGSLRRRVETMRGQTYDLLIERVGGQWYLTIHQVPRQPGVEIPDLEESFPDRPSAERAMAEFLKTH